MRDWGDEHRELDRLVTETPEAIEALEAEAEQLRQEASELHAIAQVLSADTSLVRDARGSRSAAWLAEAEQNLARRRDELERELSRLGQELADRSWQLAQRREVMVDELAKFDDQQQASFGSLTTIFELARQGLVRVIERAEAAQQRLADALTHQMNAQRLLGEIGR